MILACIPAGAPARGRGSVESPVRWSVGGAIEGMEEEGGGGGRAMEVGGAEEDGGEVEEVAAIHVEGWRSGRGKGWQSSARRKAAALEESESESEGGGRRGGWGGRGGAVSQGGD